MTYTFSSDLEDCSRKDFDITSKMSEDFFGMTTDSEQFQASEENKDFLFKHLKNFVNIIRFNKEVIGYSFIIPSNKKLMSLFLKGKITESELFDRVKSEKINENNFDCLYLCSAIIKEEHRGKGLSIEGFKKLIVNLIKIRGNVKPDLFFWEYSKEGSIVAKKISEHFGFNLFKSNN
ncbi:MAG TPA: hypothetical protein VHA12_03675 [Candidatus Nanoarchaeia archaeon]|nr:hypothetical protein [Candidatus Nanoarchaeia archaeon]